MKKIKNLTSKCTYCSLVISFLLCFQVNLVAQDQSVSSWQYRHVPGDKIAEFIKRETTYWSKVAEKAIKDKKMSFWGLFEKVGGYDLPNSSNFLFINTFPNIDSAGEIWGTAEAVAGVKMDQMETNSMSTTTSSFFLHGTGWAQSAHADSSKDFNYVEMVYHNSNYPDSLIALENKYWSPFIKKAMDNKQTSQVAWGNARVLSPSGDNIKFNTVSYDLYKTLQDALMPNFDPKVVMPTQGLNKINALEINRRGTVIYRAVKVVSD